MTIFGFVCDRCKKETTSFLKMQTERIGTRIRIKGSYWLCDKCAEDFTDRFMVLTKDETKGGDNDA